MHRLKTIHSSIILPRFINHLVQSFVFPSFKILSMYLLFELQRCRLRPKILGYYLNESFLANSFC